MENAAQPSRQARCLRCSTPHFVSLQLIRYKNAKIFQQREEPTCEKLSLVGFSHPAVAGDFFLIAARPPRYFLRLREKIRKRRRGSLSPNGQKLAKLAHAQRGEKAFLRISLKSLHKTLMAGKSVGKATVSIWKDPFFMLLARFLHNRVLQYGNGRKR